MSTNTSGTRSTPSAFNTLFHGVVRINKIAAEWSYNDTTVGGTPVSFEPALSWLEGEAYGPLAKLIAARDLGALTPQEKETLGFFVAAQFLRVKNVREANRHVHAAIANWIRERGGDPDKVRGFRPVTDDEQAKLMHIEMIKDLAPRLARILLGTKQWPLFSTDEGDPFWLSDNPVVRHNLDLNPVRRTLGLASPGIEVYLPLSPTLLLGMWCRSNVALFSHARSVLAGLRERVRRSPEYVTDVDEIILKHPKSLDQEDLDAILAAVKMDRRAQCEHEHVVFYNYLQTFWAERYVYSNKNEFALAKDIINDDPIVRRGPRMRVD